MAQTLVAHCTAKGSTVRPHILFELQKFRTSLLDPPQTFRGQQLDSSAKLRTVSPARRHMGSTTPEQLYSTGTMVSLSHRYMQQPSREASQTSPCARGTPELSVQAAKQTVVRAQHLLERLKLGSYHTSQVGCREESRAGGGASPRGRCSPPSGLSTGRGRSRTRGLGRTERSRRSDRPDTAEPRDT